MSAFTRSPSRRHRRGASAVEFAFVAPILLVLTLGAFDLSWYFVQWQTVLSSAQVGTRAGSQTKMDDQPDLVALQAADDALTANFLGSVPPETTLTASIEDNDMVRGHIWVPVTPLAGIVPLPTSMQATHQMLIEDTR